MAAVTEEPRIRHRSFTYTTTVEWAGARSGTLLSGSKPRLRVSSPPEFKGEAGVWTPEDLFVAAVNICLMTTFQAFAAKLELPIVAYSATADGLLEFADGGYRFTTIHVRPTITIADSRFVPEVARTLDDAHRNCLISNSISADVVVEPHLLVSNIPGLV